MFLLISILFLNKIVLACQLPKIIYYGDRIKGMNYQCLKHLGAKPGVTPPCSQMCPYNVTFEFVSKGNIHFTTAEEKKPDSNQYQLSLIQNNCSKGILQVIWYGKALTLYEGSVSNNITSKCSSTPNPMPCKC